MPQRCGTVDPTATTVATAAAAAASFSSAATTQPFLGRSPVRRAGCPAQGAASSVGHAMHAPSAGDDAHRRGGGQTPEPPVCRRERTRRQDRPRVEGPARSRRPCAKGTTSGTLRRPAVHRIMPDGGVYLRSPWMRHGETCALLMPAAPQGIFVLVLHALVGRCRLLERAGSFLTRHGQSSILARSAARGALDRWRLLAPQAHIRRWPHHGSCARAWATIDVF